MHNTSEERGDVMGQITIIVSDQKYTLACRDGEEERLSSLAQYVNSKAENLTENLGKIGESHVLLMSALLIADELHEARDQLSETDGAAIIGDPKHAKKLLALLDSAADTVEGIAKALEPA